MITRARIVALTAVALLCGAAVAHAQAPAAIDAALKAAHEKYENLKEGKNADYILALAKVDSKIYGIALSRGFRINAGGNGDVFHANMELNF